MQTAILTNVVAHLLDELIYSLGHVQKLVQVNTPVGELPEGTLLLDLNFRLRKQRTLLQRSRYREPTTTAIC